MFREDCPGFLAGPGGTFRLSVPDAGQETTGCPHIFHVADRPGDLDLWTSLRRFP